MTVWVLSYSNYEHHFLVSAHDSKESAIDAFKGYELSPGEFRDYLEIHHWNGTEWEDVYMYNDGDQWVEVRG